MLSCVAVCVSVLQCVFLCCSVCFCVAVCVSVLRCITLCFCAVLFYVAVCLLCCTILLYCAAVCVSTSWASLILLPVFLCCKHTFSSSFFASSLTHTHFHPLLGGGVGCYQSSLCCIHTRVQGLGFRV